MAKYRTKNSERTFAYEDDDLYLLLALLHVLVVRICFENVLALISLGAHAK